MMYAFAFFMCSLKNYIELCEVVNEGHYLTSKLDNQAIKLKVDKKLFLTMFSPDVRT